MAPGLRELATRQPHLDKPCLSQVLGEVAQLVSQVLGGGAYGVRIRPCPSVCPAPAIAIGCRARGRGRAGAGGVRGGRPRVSLPPGAAGPVAGLVGLCLGSCAGSRARHGQLTPQEEGPQWTPGPQLLAVWAVGEAAGR